MKVCAKESCKARKLERKKKSKEIWKEKREEAWKEKFGKVKKREPRIRHNWPREKMKVKWATQMKN